MLKLCQSITLRFAAVWMLAVVPSTVTITGSPVLPPEVRTTPLPPLAAFGRVPLEIELTPSSEGSGGVWAAAAPADSTNRADTAVWTVRIRVLMAGLLR